MKLKDYARLLINTVVAISLCGFVLSCGGGGDDSGSAPGKSGTITLSTSASSLPADNSSSCTITATIKDSSGDPVRHYTDVTFTTTLGRFRNGSTTYSVKTQPPTGSDGFPNPDASPTGKAEAALIAGLTSGSAKVTVSSNEVTQSIYISIVGSAGNITLTASPATMPADGVTSSTITATITDSSGTGVTPGTPVTFKAGLGLFQNGLKTFTITTPDSTGTVRVSLIAGVVPGTTYVEATANNITQAVAISLTRTDPTRSEINVDANPLRIAADGQSTSIVTATVTAIPGATAAATATGTPIAGVPVTFYDATSSSTPDPLPTDNTWTGTGSSEFVTPAFYADGAITFTMTYVGAEASNFVVVLWKIDADPNTKKYLINTTGPVTGKSVTYTLASGNYQFQVISDGYWEIKVDGDISTATATDPIVLAITQTDSNGKARYAYTSSTTPGVVTIKAETGEVSNSNAALSGTVDITQTEGPPSRVDVKATPVSTYANGENEIIIEADVYDEAGQPVPDGTVVSFSATAGTLQETSVTTSSGKAFTSLVAVTSATNVESTITATSGVYADATVVTFLGVALADMQAAPVAIFANGTDTSEITVRLKDQSGVAVVGQTVTFATTNGTLNALSAVTDADGLAKTTLIAPTVIGKATITATYGTLTANTDVSFEAVGDGSIALAVNPTSIPADGASSSVITATIKYSSGAAVPKGTSVTFATDLGTFSNGTQTYTVITPDETGVVSVSLIAGTTAGSAKITVSAINISQTVYVAIGGAAATITLAANPDSIPADGSSSSSITATIKDSSGAPVTSGTAVTFTTTLGTFSNNLQSITVDTPDGTGIVSVSLIAGVTPGTATVTAGSNGVSAATYVVIGGSVGSITLTADPTSILADGGSSSAITATVKDAAGNPVNAGTSVVFTTNLGTFSNGTATITVITSDATGVVTASLIAGTTPGTATVTAEANSVTQPINVTFSGPPDNITATANPSTLTADGTSTSTVTATVLDSNGNPVADGEVLSVTVGSGTVSQLNPTTTDGVATVTYTSPSSVPQGDIDTINFTATNGVSGAADITLTGPQVATVVLSATPTSLPADGTSTSVITATVTVSSGGTAPEGTPVEFTVSGGGYFETAGQTTITKNTNASGVATARLTAGTSEGDATIGATSSGVLAQDISVSYQPGSITLTIVPSTILATGTAEAEVTAALKDVNSNPAPNGTSVSFSLDDLSLGSIPATGTVSGGQGNAVVTFTGGTKGGTVTVTATWNTGTSNVTGTGTITIQSPPAFIELADGFPDPAKINIKGLGQSSSQLKYNVKDVDGNLVAGAYRIDFSIVTGPNGGETLIPASASTTDGQVSTLLYSGLKSGPVSIKAAYHDDTTISTTATRVVIVGGPAVGEEFGISAAYLNVSGLWKANLKDAIGINAADNYGNAIADNTAISFKTYNTGGFFETGTGTTTGGVASDNLVSGGTYLTPLNGFVSTTAEVVGGNTTRVSALAVTPSATSIVYAGTNGGGVYKSTDSGATWTNISRSSENPKQGQNWIDPYIKGHSAISVDPDDANTVYVGTGYLGKGALYLSRDGGNNWNSNNLEQWAGLYNTKSAVLTVLCDDGTDYVWFGTEGEGVFVSALGEDFDLISVTGLGYGTTANEIIKDPTGPDGANAILYAATPNGLYRSTGGAGWTPLNGFTNDIINAIAIHPNGNIIYAGTDSAGVWVYDIAAASWTQYYPLGMGKGLASSVPVPDPDNAGNGFIDEVEVFTDTESQFWAVTCTAPAAGGGTFKVEGSVSGLQASSATVGTAYTSNDGQIRFTISPGSIDFVVGDNFTFTTTRDPGSKIKDLMVDTGNDRLYAITYYFSQLEPYHAVGNVYAHGLEANGTMSTGDWTEANTGLPEYSPPNDTTLFAQHVMATNNESSPTWFLIGGEGINLYKTTTPAAPDWKTSKTGLSNLIMARMPVLFSGNCTMTITETGTDPNFDYDILIQDKNGNPPISASEFKVETYDVTGAFISTVRKVIYPDTYTYEGTFRDPAVPSTDDPFDVSISFTGSVAEAKFTFTPTCQTAAPGCSGADQEESYFH